MDGDSESLLLSLGVSVGLADRDTLADDDGDVVGDVDGDSDDDGDGAADGDGVSDRDGDGTRDGVVLSVAAAVSDAARVDVGDSELVRGTICVRFGQRFCDFKQNTTTVTDNEPVRLGDGNRFRRPVCIGNGVVISIANKLNNAIANKQHHDDSVSGCVSLCDLVAVGSSY